MTRCCVRTRGNGDGGNGGWWAARAAAPIYDAMGWARGVSAPAGGGAAAKAFARVALAMPGDASV